MKEIKDHLHYYMGCDCIYEDDFFVPSILKINGKILERWNDNFKLSIRPLSDMTEDEKKLLRVNPTYAHNEYSPTEFHDLLKLGFDMFGLIENNLAIDKTTIAI